ncbi:MAG: InlB B-repeat-containing protein [Treponema sp.]|nr:InlB B-repeat-containing protein [Treponema sp.]
MKRKSIYVAAAGLALFLLAACTMAEPEIRPDGAAAARISIEAEGRTVRPAAALGNVTKWKLQGGKKPGVKGPLVEFSNTAPAAARTVYLEPGEWVFTLTGYKGNNEILQGEIAGQNITLAGDNLLSFKVAPVLGGLGKVRITLTLPAGHGITRAEVYLNQVKTGNITPDNNKVVYQNDSMTAGDYYISIRLYNGSDLYGVKSEIVQVRKNLLSEKGYTLGTGDLNLKYLITYNSNGGGFSGGMTTGYYRSTDAKDLPTPTRAGYVFEGWYADPGLTERVSRIEPGSTGDKQFWAKWAAKPVTGAP